MESLRAIVEAMCPKALEHKLDIYESQGKVCVGGQQTVLNASRLNMALRKFELECPTEKLTRRVQFYIPKVRLGDVTTEEEREILAWVTGYEIMWPHRIKNTVYLNPDSYIHLPEWNSDFVKASDVREQKFIKPRFCEDDPETIDAVAEFVASYWKGGGIVAHTGAGISASAGIRTFREGNTEKGISIDVAMPTYAHYTLVALTKAGKVNHTVSQNVDGLHRRSGMAGDGLSELHGNAYIEHCECCTPRMEFIRPYDVNKRAKSHGVRKCPTGGGPLYDSIIHFGMQLPLEHLRKARECSKAATLNLVLGSSLLVQPACHVPFKHITLSDEEGYEDEPKGAQHGVPVVIVSKSCTGFDLDALNSGGVCLRTGADEFMERLVKHAGLQHLENSPEVLASLAEHVRARDQAVLDNNDGGPVPSVSGGYEV